MTVPPYDCYFTKAKTILFDLALRHAPAILA